MMRDRLNWLFFRRQKLRRLNAGFNASFTSYATPDCLFEGHNSLAGKTTLQSVRLGRGSYVNSARLNGVSVGRFCSIGFEAVVGLGEHPTDRFSTHPVFYSPRNPLGLRWVQDAKFEEAPVVNLGSDVWIGARAVVLSGVSIGHGAIVAAGSVVTRDVPPFAIVAGVPAKLIRMRANDDLIASILELRWWDAPILELPRCVSSAVAPLNDDVVRELRVVLGSSRDAEAWT
jgi:virginiamycin A acetyltransferase